MFATVASRVQMSVLLVVALIGAMWVLPARAADAQADLKVELVAPASGAAGGPFTYTLTIEDQGPAAADGTTFSFTLPVGASQVTATCASATGAATCPTDLVVAAGKVTGTIGTFPARTRVNITVNGKFGAGTSASATLTASVPAGVVDPDPASNSATQGTTLNNQATIVVTKTQDKDHIAVGETVTYTVKYANPGVNDVVGIKVWDELYADRNISGELTIKCGAGNTAPCPSFANSAVYDWKMPRFNYNPYSSKVTIPAGTTLEFVVAVTPTAAACSAQSSVALYNTASYDPAPGYTLNGTNLDEVRTTVTGLEPCPRAEIDVTKTQDKNQIAIGETVTYTITYNNPSATDIAGINVRDKLYASMTISGELTVKCGAANTAPCPSFANGRVDDWKMPILNYYPYSSKVTIPARTTLQLVVAVTPTAAACSAQSSVGLLNTASYDPAPGYTLDGISSSQVRTTVTGLQPCPVAKIDVTKTQDKAEVAAGETVTYTIKYTNSGPADVVGLDVRDELYAGTSISGKLTVKCGAGSTVPCPSFANNKVADWKMPQIFYYAYAGKVNLPVGATLEVVVAVTPTAVTCPATGKPALRNTGLYNQMNGYTLTGNSSSVAVTSVLCVDVASNTVVSSSSPAAGELLPVSVTVGNAAGVAQDLPVSIALPAGGYFYDPAAGDTVECEVVSGAGTCPTALTYDAATHSVRGVVSSLPAGAQIRITVKGRAGLIPLIGASYSVDSTAPARGDTNPASNDSNATFGIVNEQTSIGASVRITGDTVPVDTTFTGTISCKSQGNFPFSVTVPAGENTGQVQASSTLWKHDTCTATLDAPPPLPSGYEWGKLTSENPQTATDITDPVVFPFELRLHAQTPPAPVTTSANLVVKLTGNTSALYMTFTGSLQCSSGVNVPVSVTVPTGEDTATVVVASDLVVGQDCTMTLNHPAAPAGLVWVPPVNTNPQTITLTTDPATYTYAFELTAPTSVTTSANLVVKVTGDTSRSNLVFTGSLQCSSGVNVPASVTFPAGANSATAVVATGLEVGQDCTMTLNHPAAPAGQVWAPPVNTNPQTITLTTDPATYTYNYILNPAPGGGDTPTPGGGDTPTPGGGDTPTSGGAPSLPVTGTDAQAMLAVSAMLVLAGLTLVGARRLRRR